MTTLVDVRTARRMTRALFILGAVALPATALTAQVGARGYLGTLTYATALPTGDSKNFADDYSWLGFTLEGDWFLRPNMSTGFIIGWQEIYKEQDGDSFDFDNGTATGRTYRHLMAVPLLVRGRYWIGEPGRSALLPFVGAGVGTYWMKQTLDFGILTADEDHWHFGLAPEVGVLMATRGGVAWTLNARYNYPFETGDYLNGQKASWAYWGFAIGLGFAR
jgi:hypothetical protein